MTVQTPLEVAQSYTGTRAGDKLLDRFLNKGGAGLSSTEYAWCSRFIQRTAQAAGYDVGTATDMARSWLNVGKKLDKPEIGAVAVYPRGAPKSGLGHVGYVRAINPDGTIMMLSGNDKDSVRESRRPTSGALGFRRLMALGAPGEQTQEPDPSAPIHATTMVGAPSGVMITDYGREKSPPAMDSPGVAIGPPSQDWASLLRQQMRSGVPALPGALDAQRNSPQYKQTLIGLLGGLF